MAYLRLVYYYHLFIGFAEMYNKTYLRFLGFFWLKMSSRTNVTSDSIFFRRLVGDSQFTHSAKKIWSNLKIYIIKSKVSVQHQYIQKVTLNGLPLWTWDSLYWNQKRIIDNDNNKCNQYKEITGYTRTCILLTSAVLSMSNVW